MQEEILARPLTSRFANAVAFACELHRTQTRRGTQIPYVAHLLGVASLALEHGADEDEAIAAILHDAVEDQGGAPTAVKIRDRFGERVAEIVLSCSDTDVVPKPPWRARKEKYVAHLAEATESARLVSACDKLHNARAILSDYRELGEALWGRFREGREGTLWYYRAVLEQLRASPPGPSGLRLVDELERAVEALERLAPRSPPVLT
jgi:(p)ppGpp synthase/HD superfamily hydrolase